MVETNRVMTIHWKDHNQQFAQGLWNLFNKEYMVDTTVSFYGDPINVHRLVLSVFIPFFTKMTPENAVNELKLDYVANQKEDVQSLLEFVYTGKTTIAADRIVYVRNLARELDFKGFMNSIEECEQSDMDRNMVENYSCIGSASVVVEDESSTEAPKLLQRDDNLKDIVKSIENNFQVLSEDIKSVECHVRLNKMDTSKPKVVSSAACKTTITKKPMKCTSVRETTDNPCNSELTVSLKSRTRSQSVVLGDKRSTNDESKKQRKSSTETSEQEDDSDEYITTEDLKSPEKKCRDRSRVPMKCGHCEYITHSKSGFRTHIKQHEHEGFKCDKCNKKFKVKKSLRFHNKTSCEQDFQFICNYCGHQTLRQSTLEEHLAAKHKVDLKGNPLEENVKCTKCDFVCFAKHQLNQHVLRKHNDKKFECPQCEYVAVVRNELKRHISIRHLKERNYVCDECGVSFQTRGALNGHIQTKHKGMKLYKCNECNKEYVCHHSYKIHMSKHTGTEKFYVCHICGHSFNKRYYLGTHMKKHHGLEMEPVKKVYAPRQNATNEIDITKCLV